MKDKFNNCKLDLYNGIANIINQYVYEPNHSQTWDRIRINVESYVNEFLMLNQIHLNNYKIICDNTTNTPTIIEQNNLVLLFVYRVNIDSEYTIVKFTVQSAEAVELSEMDLMTECPNVELRKN